MFKIHSPTERVPMRIQLTLSQCGEQIPKPSSRAFTPRPAVAVPRRVERLRRQLPCCKNRRFAPIHMTIGALVHCAPMTSCDAVEHPSPRQSAPFASRLQHRHEPCIRHSVYHHSRTCSSARSCCSGSIVDCPPCSSPRSRSASTDSACSSSSRVPSHGGPMCGLVRASARRSMWPTWLIGCWPRA